jgi:tRNA nucleotidyltransferase (CCA-adding enzyme)
MQQMVDNGDVDALVRDRVWKETEAALAGPNPQVFFEVLRSCGALAVIYPEIEALFGVPQPPKWHPEIDSGAHSMMVLRQAARLSEEVPVRFAALVHDLGKATTDAKFLPRHPGHERRSVKIIRSLASRIPIPNACSELACLVAEYHAHCHRALELRPTTTIKVLNHTDAFRRPERFEQFLLACEADARGRTGYENAPYPQAEFFRGAYAAAKNIEIDDLTSGAMDGSAIGREINRRREAAVRQYKKNYAPPK